VCPPLGSYDEWTKFVRAPLVWLGEADPAESMEALRGEDPELASVRELFARWPDAMSLDTPYTAAELIDRACGLDGADPHPELRQVIQSVAGDRGPPSGKRLGKWLTRIKGRIVDGKRLVAQPDAKHGNRYRLVEQKTRGG
jgi:putative DNA primase/helicase